VSARPCFVFDTSALLSAALLKQSVSRKALDKALREGELLVSAETIDELNQVLGRSEFAQYVTENERLEFLAILRPCQPWQLLTGFDQHVFSDYNRHRIYARLSSSAGRATAL
jgi:predicted nucleic acid-binding protein